MAEAIPTSVEQLLIASSAGRGPYKLPVKAGSTVNLTLSGEQTVGGVACVDGDRVLAAGQTDPKQNGIWIVKVGPWVRATDHDSDRDCTLGARVEVLNGTNKGDWHMTAPTTGTVTPNVTAQTWTFENPASIQGPEIDIGTELSNTDIDIGNGTTSTITIEGANANLFAGTLIRIGQGGAGETLNITYGTDAVNVANLGTLRLDVAPALVIRDNGQSAASFTFTPDYLGGSPYGGPSLVIDQNRPFTLTQAQKTTGAGVAMTIRAQRGQAGQVGGALILGGGPGGTPGTNAGGPVRVKLCTPVAGVTAPFYLEREDGTPVMTTYEIATGIVGHYFGSAGGSHQGIVRGATLGLESSAGLVAIQPATDLYIGHASNRDIIHREVGTTVLTEHLDADGETRLRFASGPTAIKIDHSQHASGAGVTMTVRAQQGASGQVGGHLELGSGLGGTAGTNAPGNIKLRVGAQAGGQTGHVLLTDESSGDTDFLRMRRVGTATYLESLAGDLNLSATAAAQIIATSTMVFRGTSAFFDADTVYHRTNALASYWTEVKGTAQATTATTTTVAQFATSSNRVYLVEAFFTASNDTDNQGTAMVYQAAFKNVAGTVTQIESPVAINKFRDAGSSGHDATIDFSGTTIRARYSTTDTDTVNINCVMRVYERVLV